MRVAQTLMQDNVIKRILLLYGLYTLFSNAFFLIGYHLLPEGIFRGHPVASFIAQEPNFWLHFGETLIFNLIISIIFGIGLNLFMFREGIPFGYVLVVCLGIIGGLIVGTNSFMDDLLRYSILEGLSKGLLIGELEMLGRILLIAATAGISIYIDDTPWYSLQTKIIKVKDFRDIRLSKQEWIALLIGILLLIIAAYNETMMWLKEIVG